MKAEIQSGDSLHADLSTDPGGNGGKPTPRRLRLPVLSPALARALLLAGGLLLPLAILVAALQPPAPVYRQPPPGSGFPKLQWWLAPIERNAAARLPAVEADIHAVFALPDRKNVWAVGQGGLILHSADGGECWEQQHPVKRAPVCMTPAPEWSLPFFKNAQAADSGQGPPPSFQRAEGTAGGSASSAHRAPDGKAGVDRAGPAEPDYSTPDNSTPSRQTAPDPVPNAADPPANAVSKAPQAGKSSPPGKAGGRGPENAPVTPARADLPNPNPSSDAEAETADQVSARTPDAQRALEIRSATLRDVGFMDERFGGAVGERGALLMTRDGGRNWLPREIGERDAFVSITYHYGGLVPVITRQKNGWISGNHGEKFFTKPFKFKLSTPSVKHASLFVTGEKAILNAVIDAEGSLLLALSGFRVEDWSKVAWKPVAPSITGLNFVHALDPSTVWAAGKPGALRLQQLRGKWRVTRTTLRDTPLQSIRFADATHGWASGAGGLLLRTTDAGLSWQQLTRGPAAGDYLRLPAPWFYPVALLSFVAAFVGALAPRRADGSTAPPISEGIAQMFLADRPLRPGENDRFGHGHLAEGLAKYLLNRHTRPGVVIAVTGGWGSGKTSVLGLLQHRLESEGFRPAWFNAWHHQLEGRQLASMLNTIRRQAVPSLLGATLVQGVRVRARLLWARGWLYRLAAVGLLAIVLVAVWQLLREGDPLGSLERLASSALRDDRAVVLTGAAVGRLKKDNILGEDLRKLVEDRMMWRRAGHGTCLEAGDGGCEFGSLRELLLSLEKLAGRRITDEERAALSGAVHHLSATSPTMLAAIFSALVLPLLVGKGVAIYGLNYLDLLRGLLPNRAQADKEAVGTVEHMRDEFARLTEALDGRLVLLIDDLDRCNCDTVHEVLETTNYLVTSGQCFVVFGMAAEHVLECVSGMPAAGDAEGAKRYLQKLIHIEAPVPPTTAAGVGELLRPTPFIPDPKKTRWGDRGWFWLLLLALMAYTVAATWRWLNPEAAPRTFTEPPPVVTAPQATGPGSASPKTGDPSRLSAPETPPPAETVSTPSGAGGAVPGLKPAASAGTLLPHLAAAALALALLVYALLRSTPELLDRLRLPTWLKKRIASLRMQLGEAQRIDDSAGFTEALARWAPLVHATQPTPRAAKRFVNYVRLLAMLETTQGDERIPDSLLVALMALHYAFGRQLPSDLAALQATSWREFFGVSGLELEEHGDQARFELAQAALRETRPWPPTAEQWRRFRALVREMKMS